MGRSCASIFDQFGARLVLVGRRKDKLKETVDLLKNNSEVKEHRYYQFDLEDVNDLESFIENIVSDVGPLDGFVYCAGISGDRPLKMCKPEYVDSMFNVNFFSFYESVRVLIKRKNHNKCFSIIGISGGVAKKANKGQSIYSAGKAAMDASVRVIAQEIGDINIRINTIQPGMIKTSMYDEFINRYGDNGILLNKSQQILEPGNPEDVAYMASYLLSDKSKYITGAHIPVDGGYSAC